jgi:uncharacterized protein YuzE
MKLSYYSETDSLYIEFCDSTVSDVLEIVQGLNADIDKLGRIVGLDIDQASNLIDLSTLEIAGLPYQAIAKTA